METCGASSQVPPLHSGKLETGAKAEGYDIDNFGQIAGVGERNGRRYGVLLQPVPGGTLGFIPPTPAWP